MRIPKYAIRSKVEERTTGYHLPEKHTVVVSDFDITTDFWEGIDYNIDEGRIIRDIPKQQTLL